MAILILTGRWKDLGRSGTESKSSIVCLTAEIMQLLMLAAAGNLDLGTDRSMLCYFEDRFKQRRAAYLASADDYRCWKNSQSICKDIRLAL